MLLPTMELHEGIWPSPTYPITATVMTHAQAFPSCSRRGVRAKGTTQLPPGQHQRAQGSSQTRETALQETLGEPLKSTSLRQRHRFSTPEHYIGLFLRSGITGWKQKNWMKVTCLNWPQVKRRVDTFPNVFHREHSSFWSFLELRFCNCGGVNLKSLKVNGLFSWWRSCLVVVFKNKTNTTPPPPNSLTSMATCLSHLIHQTSTAI